MREILFRGQHRRYGEHVNMAGEKIPPVWVYGGVLQGEGDFSIIYGSKSPDGKFEKKYPVYTETLGQYTGLTDKNGKKIFEGDIVRHGYTCKYSDGKTADFYSNMPVSFSNHYGGWIVGVQGILTIKTVQKYNIEVIGNIHDNPELLKEAAND